MPQPFDDTNDLVLSRQPAGPGSDKFLRLPMSFNARRVGDGKTSRDATRLLKRYLARHLYRVMQNSTPLTT